MLCGHLDKLNTLKIVLGSKSESRQTLLKQAGLKFDTVDSGFPEDLKKELFQSPAEYVRATALGKLESLASKTNLEYDILISCDTIVVFESNILEKPADEADHAKMMQNFSGKSNQVISHVFVIFKKDGNTTRREASSITDLVFADIPHESIAEMSKIFPSLLGAAGGYQIQTFSASIIREIKGSHSGVIGLPMYEFCSIILDAIKTGVI